MNNFDELIKTIMPLKSVLMLFFIFIIGCATNEGEKDTDNFDVKTQVYSGGSACTFNASWITGGDFPSEVDGGDFCDFQQFMWHAFTEITKPSSTTGKLVFETWMPTYGIFVGPGKQPSQWGSVPPNQCATAPGDTKLMFTNLTKQAGVGQPLVDQQGNKVYYGISLNETAYNFVTDCDLYKSECAAQLDGQLGGVDLIKKYPKLAFPDGSVELKSAWKQLTPTEASSGKFYKIEGLIQPNAKKPTQCETKTLGLVGLHIVAKTANHPEFIWGTFEQENNAPDCTDLSPSAPVGDWTFFDSTTYNNCDGEYCTNHYQSNTPTQVCREHPYGDSNLGRYPNGNNCTVTPNQRICQPEVKQQLTDNTTAIKSINANAKQVFNAGHSVWSNYFLTGNVWTSDGSAAATGVVPASQRAWSGSLSSANISMETYVQNGQAGIMNPANCFTCHSMVSADGSPDLPPVGLSHIFNQLIPKTGGCETGNLPASCPIGDQ